MRILQWKVPSDYELILFGDNQEGNALQYKKGYQECIQYVLDAPHRYAIHHGDEQEAYWIDDPRYLPFILQTSPLDQQKQVIKDLLPLARKKRLITLLYGNHSHRLYPKVGNITKSTCETLGIEYGSFSCSIAYVDKWGVQFKHFATHGKRPIRSIADDPIRREANEQLQLKQHLKNKAGDTVLQSKGHTHRLIVSEPKSQLYLTTDETHIQQNYTGYGGQGYIHPDHRWFVNSGSFLKSQDENLESYSEMAEYDPIPLGYAVVTVHDRKIADIRKVLV